MQVNRIQSNNYNNQPSFGMKYINPREWHGEVLDSLRNSSLAKEIDAKYPNAKVWWLSQPIIGSKKSRALSLFIKLADNTNPVKIFRSDRALDTRYGGLVSHCCQKIKNTRLEDLEKVL